MSIVYVVTLAAFGIKVHVVRNYSCATFGREFIIAKLTKDVVDQKCRLPC